MALIGKISVILYIVLFFIMIENSISTKELTRDIRSPTPTRGFLYICTEENMKRKFFCIICKGHDLSCFSSSTTSTTSTTTSSTTTSSTPSSPREPTTTSKTNSTPEEAPAE